MQNMTRIVQNSGSCVTHTHKSAIAKQNADASVVTN